MKKKRSALFTSLLALLLCVSMLMGTTLAWFTDSVSSKNNQILAGSLDVELEQYVDGKWVRVNESTNVFEEDTLWEPGHTEVVYLRIANVGDLALKYGFGVNIAEETGSVNVAGEDFKLSDHIRYGIILSDSQQTYADRASARAALQVSQLINQAYTSDAGSLLPAGEKYVTMVVYMPEEVGNEANYATGAAIPTIKLGLTLMATQEVHESDSFGSDYDASAEVPGFDFPDTNVSDSASAKVDTDGEGKVSAAVTMQGSQTAAEVPAGVQLEGGATELKLTVNDVDQSQANLTLGDNESQRSVDVHIEGVSKDNTVPMAITLRELAPKGLNMGNYKLYHVENGVAVEMTYVASDAAFSAHNQFKYDPATGDVVLYMATFSEIAMTAEKDNAWKGNFDYSWYTNAVAPVDGEAVTEYIIANADQLAGFGAIVGGMVGKTEDSFKDKHIKLISDINLGDKESENNPDIIFYPIGYWNNEGTYERLPAEQRTNAVSSSLKNFCGTFDGQGHTVSNFYQNTWEMKGDHDWYDPIKEQYYRDGMGLFGRVYGGAVKNLTVKNFSSDGEIATTGVIAAYADFGATFENIAITNCNPRVYNIGNGGIVGCVGWYTKGETDKKVTFKNITVDNSNKISALWGSYDVACGGIVGQYYPTSGQSSANYPVNPGIAFDNCHVAAVMDVYNDVCGNYQYYAYRYAGMLIGSVRENVTIDGHVYPKMDGITASGCTVHFGTWNDYYYCEIIDNTTASYTHDYQMSRLTEIKAIDGTTITYLDGTTGTVPTSGRANYVIVDYTKGHGTENATCYHFKDGAVWTHDMGGIQTGIDENGDGQDDLKEDKQHIYLEFNNLVTGYGWGVTSRGFANLDGVTNLDITEGGQDESVEKFTVKLTADSPKLESEVAINVGDLFEEKNDLPEKLAVNDSAVQVAVTGLNNSGIIGTYEADVNDWTKGTLTFNKIEGLCTVTIQDYKFCKPTTFALKDGKLYDLQKFDIVFPNVDKYLYRVGNLNNVPLANLFKETGEAAVNDEKVTVTVTNSAGEIMEVYSADQSKWENGYLKFDENYTGVVKVVIAEEGSFEKVLNLEVVKAKNITSADSSDGVSVVLLQDVKIQTNGTANYKNCTVYGNGFTFDVRGGMNQYNSKQGHGIIIAKYATLDHLRVIGDVYDTYGLYAKDFFGNLLDDYTGAIDAEFCIIQNCYIAHCAAPIRSNGNKITDTVLYGGTIANLLISGGTNTLTNVTTVNYNDERGTIGAGIVITDGADADTTKLVLNGYLKQHNFVSEDDIDQISVEDAQEIFTSMFDNQFSEYHFGAAPNRQVNTGIISINKEINLDEEHFEDNANTGYKIENDVTLTISAYGQSETVEAAIASMLASENSVDNNFSDTGNAQGDYLPTFDFNLGDQAQAKDNDDDTRYLIGDKNGLSAMYPKGEAALTLDLTTLATVTKYTNVSYPVTAKCIGPDGNEQTGTVTLADKGTYTLVFTVDDNVHYDENGNKIEKSVTRTYEVTLVLDLYEKSIADATMTISSSSLAGEYVNSGSNKKYKMYPLKAITSIMDDANKDGVLETFNFKSNIQSAVLTPESNNAFSSPTTITITYTGGQVLTIVLGTPSGLNSPGASNGGKTFSVVIDNTNGNGIYLQSDGAIASSSAATGTWPLTSWSFKGTSGKVITNSTKVTIDFTKPSGGGGCVTSDTLVTLADGTQKRIDQVAYTDQLLVWDFYKGAYATVPAAIIFDHGYDNNTVIKLNFSDGTTVKAVNLHQFFDADLNQLVSIDANTVADYVGHKFVKQNGKGYKTVTLVDYTITEEYCEAWGIISAEHYNIFVEGMLSADFMLEDFELFNYFEVGKNLKFDEKKMQADIAKYGLYTYEDFAEYLTYEQFVAFNVQYFKIPVGKGEYTYEGILKLIDTYLNAN